MITELLTVMIRVTQEQWEQQDWARKQCVLDATTNQPWMFDSLAVLAMDSERGVYVENTHQHEGEFRYYLNDPDVPVSKVVIMRQCFTFTWVTKSMIHSWGWGLTMGEEPGTGDIIALTNQGGTMLDPYATLDDVEELANFILREYDPRTGDWSHTIETNIIRLIV